MVVLQLRQGVDDGGVLPAVGDHPQVTAATVQADTSCDRGGPDVTDTGAGRDGGCMITWDDTGTQQHGTLALQVHANARWTANGRAETIGSSTPTDAAGRQVAIPVNALDGCSDPDAPVT
jgi:hypothetical protein